jgi:hypothetical protein
MMTTLNSDTPTAPAAQPDMATLPVRVDRKTAAELVTRYFFPSTTRGVEIWPLDWRLVNGKAVCETVDLFAVAQAKLDAAPLTRTARRQAA